MLLLKETFPKHWFLLHNIVTHYTHYNAILLHALFIYFNLHLIIYIKSIVYIVFRYVFFIMLLVCICISFILCRSVKEAGFLL